MSDDGPAAPALTWSTECSEVFTAFAKAQSGMESLGKSKTAKLKGKAKGSGKEYEYGYSYADLPSSLAACLGAFNEAGLAIIQTPRIFGNGVEVTTLVTHGSGQWIMSAPLFLPVVTNGAQDAGSGITYARRYALQAIVGISPSDDDGAAAHANAPDTWERKTPPTRRATANPTKKDIGARCTGKAANIAVALERRLKALADRDNCGMDQVWDRALDHVALDVDKYGADGIGRAESLTIADGKLVSTFLADRLGDQDPTSEAAP